MKTNFFFARTLAKAALAGGIALAVIASSSAFAVAATNTDASPAKHSLGIKFNVGPDNSDATNYYGLPKEAFDRLSPEQIVELAKTHEPPAAMMVTIPIAMFAMIIACVALGVSSKLKRSRMQHETLRLMIEKGQPIPPELLKSPDGFRRPRNDLRNGLVLISIGVGLGAMLLAEHDTDWPVALIPLLIGVAFLIARKLESNNNGQPR